MTELRNHIGQEFVDRALVDRRAKQKQADEDIERRYLPGVVEHLLFFTRSRRPGAADALCQLLGVVATGIEKDAKLTDAVLFWDLDHGGGSLTEVSGPLVS